MNADIGERDYYSTEAQIQTAGINALRTLGYLVFETGRTRSKTRCPRCGVWSYPKGWQGNTPFTPDLYVTHPYWGAGEWTGIECKRGDGVVSIGQQALADTDRTFLCYSAAQVLFAVLLYEEMNHDNRQEEVKLRCDKLKGIIRQLL